MTGCGARKPGNSREGFSASLLAEIAALLEQLAGTGVGGAIDLRSLPMDTEERAGLEMFLGQGEVDAKLSTAGSSEVRETKYPGVWWVRHHGVDGRITSELIEVTLVPEILKTHRDDLPGGLQRLCEDMDRQFEFQSGENE